MYIQDSWENRHGNKTYKIDFVSLIQKCNLYLSSIVFIALFFIYFMLIVVLAGGIKFNSFFCSTIMLQFKKISRKMLVYKMIRLDKCTSNNSNDSLYNSAITE